MRYWRDTTNAGRLLSGVFFLLWFASGAFAAPNQGPTLDELLDLAPRPDDRGGTPIDPEAATGGLEEAVGADPTSDAFELAVRQMDEVSVLLGRHFDAGLATQRLQESILAKLDQVIAAARQQVSGQSGSSSSGARPQDAGGASVADQSPVQEHDHTSGVDNCQVCAASAGVNGGRAPEGSVEEAGRNRASLSERRTEWGNLPPRLREELTEGLTERFSPVYRALTEAYYRRLAEE